MTKTKKQQAIEEVYAALNSAELVLWAWRADNELVNIFGGIVTLRQRLQPLAEEWE